MSHACIYLASVVTVSLAMCQPLHAQDAISLGRGSYLVNGIAACTSCHASEANNQGDPNLAGGRKFGSGENQVFAPNITPDVETGVGSWSDTDLIDAIRNCRRPDGSRIGPPMPQTFRFMSDADIKSIVLYLRSLPAVTNKVVTKIPIQNDSTSTEDVKAVPSPDMTDPIKRGRYIADGLAHCSACHTKVSPTSPEFCALKNQGGRLFKIATGTLVAPGITNTDLASYTDSELINIITKGTRPDGKKIIGPMPVTAYAKISAQDLSDLIAFLRH